MKEAELSTIQCTATQQAAIAFDKSLRLTSKNPRRNIAEERVQQRTTKQSWQSKATESWKTIFGTKIEAAPFSGSRKPWERVTCKTERTDTKKSVPPNVQRRQALVKILNTETTEVTAYTDGSAVGSNRNGGAGVFIVAGDERLEVARPAGISTSSFQANLVSLNTALKDVP